MTDDANSRALMTILETLAVLTTEVDAVAQRQNQIERSLASLADSLDAEGQKQGRIEPDQAELVRRLYMLDAGQAAIRQHLMADRVANQASLMLIAELAAHAQANAYGNRAPLPVDVADSPLLERFLIAQPADHNTRTRALDEWRTDVGQLSSTDLTTILARQYQPSPTDTPETRVLRYQLAAISRAELLSRGVMPPAPPRTTIARDQSVEARQARSKELADMWREGLSVALLAEPELAGALDRFVSAGIYLATKPGQSSDDLIKVYQQIGDSIEAGDRFQGEPTSLGRLSEASINAERKYDK